MKRNLLVKFFLGIVVFYAVVGIVKFFLDYGQPNFANELVNDLTSDGKLYNEIGSYEGYEFAYSRKDAQKDSLVFVLKINGFEGSIKYEGLAVKKNNEWTLKRMVKQNK